MRHARQATVMLAVAAVVAMLPSVARADVAHCNVRNISASPAGAEGQIDPSLDDLRRKLTRPPFTSWKTFRLVSESKADLTPGASSTFTVPGGREGTLTYKEHVGGPGKSRVRLQLQIKDAAAPLISTTLVLDEGGTVLTAGMKYGDGIIIIGVSCTTS